MYPRVFGFVFWKGPQIERRRSIWISGRFGPICLWHGQDIDRTFWSLWFISTYSWGIDSANIWYFTLFIASLSSPICLGWVFKTWDVSLIWLLRGQRKQHWQWSTWSGMYFGFSQNLPPQAVMGLEYPWNRFFGCIYRCKWTFENSNSFHINVHLEESVSLKDFLG